MHPPPPATWPNSSCRDDTLGSGSAFVRPGKRSREEESDPDEIEFIRPRRSKLSVKTPEAETFYAREFTEGEADRRAQRRIPAATIQPGDAGGHLLFESGGLIWCWHCGRYSLKRAHALKIECSGGPGSGQAYRLKRLRQGKHPATNKLMVGRTIRMLA